MLTFRRLREDRAQMPRRGRCKMERRKGVLRLLQTSAVGIGAVVLFASTATAGPDSSPRSRVTILGTGSAVSIERTQEPGRALTREVHLPPGPLGDAIAMKLEGADDATV